MLFKVLAPTTTRIKFWNKEPGVSGNQGGCTGKWPLRDRVGRGMFWVKKLDREITLGTALGEKVRR